MTRLTIEVPETAFSALRKGPEEFAAELRLVAAAKWYDLGRISQQRAAEIAGLSRAAFIAALGPLGVSAIQCTPEELREEVEGA